MYEMFYYGEPINGWDEERVSLNIFFDTEDEADEYIEKNAFTADGYEVSWRYRETA